MTRDEFKKEFQRKLKEKLKQNKENRIRVHIPYDEIYFKGTEILDKL